MKFLISDYDGTLKSDLRNLRINISAINRFRSNGNHFAIATGRSYESIKEEIKKYNIKYDYLITNDGAITFDESDNIIDFKIPDENVLEKIYSIISNTYQKKLCAFKLPNSNKMIELQILTSIFNNLNDLEILIKKYPCIQKTNLKILPFKFTFLKAFATKSDAIKKILEINKQYYDDIITVGDGRNDIDMLNDFSGYKMFYCYPCLYKYNFKITKEVHTLIKKIERN